MKNKTILRILLFSIYCFWCTIISGQTQPVDTAKMYKVSLTDGSVLFGNILERDADKIVLKTTSMPKVEIQASKVERLEVINPANVKNGVYWFPNPHATRYLFGPSAFNLKKGEGYYQNTMLSLNSFNVGITDNISVGGAIELISTFSALTSGEFGPIFFITPKAGFKVNEKFHAGGGLLYVLVGGFGSEVSTGLGIAYGISTYGTPDNNITAGLGWGYVDGDFSSKPIITISGTKRISRKVALVTENWIIPIDSYYGLISYGVRFLGERTAIDLAFVNSPDIVEFLAIGIPFVSFTLNF